ncbi:DUF1294 domain-containing protein [Pseudooctadecabacter sp.]|uniref:DUF1294 domain-containing protein n=1 Tax=Pseudooctadecabacter sp. TaxID=1966338 RepID=UPI0035C84D82
MSEFITSHFFWIGGAIGLALFNITTYLAFALDKDQARRGGRRIPENTLLTLSLFGGSIGAKLAQRRFRHKTRKQPFGLLLNLICIAQIGLIGALVFAFIR